MEPKSKYNFKALMQERHSCRNFQNKEIPENLIKDGIDIIYQSFNTNMENYIVQIKELKKIINDLNKKLELMKEEIEMLQRENEYYKTQNKKLKNGITKNSRRFFFQRENIKTQSSASL